MPENKKGLHAGHRKRMKEKLLKYGSDVFNTHELIEMLLFYTIPYKNTNSTACELMSRFSTLDGLLCASKSELTLLHGVGDRTAELISALSLVTVENSTLAFSDKSRLRFTGYADVGAFLAKQLSGEEYETVMLLLDNGMNYINLVRIAAADCGTAAVGARPFVDAALDFGASVCVIAHNHPFGPLYPTPSDKVATEAIRRALSAVGVTLGEHYVVSGDKFVGFMNDLSAAFDAVKPDIRGGL